jgi:hypothetical protein
MLDLEKMAKTYLKMRAKCHAITKAADDEVAAIKAKMAVIENAAAQHLHQIKANSVATPAGTFYRQEDIKPSVGDWDALYTWIAEHNEFEMLERRVKKTAVAEYMERTKGHLPPGVAVHREYVVRVRQPS